MAVFELTPDHVSLAWTRLNPARKQHPGVVELSDRRHRRSGSLEGVKQQAQGALNLLVRIQDQSSGGIVSETNRRSDEQFPTSGFVENPALQPGAQHVQLGFTHGSFQTEQQSVVKVGWIVETVLVQDQGISQSADLQQAVPVHGIACQPGDLQAEHHSGATQTDLGHQTLKAFAIRGASSRLPQIGIDDGDLILWPTQSDRLLAQCILPLGAFRVLEDLTKGGLSNIEISGPFQMGGLDLLMRVGSHTILFEALLSNILVRRSTTSDRRPEGNGCTG
jgi:hypothetical protein